jgi:hypothetical protein
MVLTMGYFVKSFSILYFCLTINFNQMDMMFLDSKISKQSQLRIIVGLLCTLVLYTILMDFVSQRFTHESDVRKIFFGLANVFVFFYLYKFIRYDLKLKLHVIFISVAITINMYFVLLRLYKSIIVYSLNDSLFYSIISIISYVILMLKLIVITGIAIQLLLNKYFKKKIKIIIQVLGVSFLLQIIGPMIMSFLYSMFIETLLMTGDDVNTLYKFTDAFFNITPYIVMIYLYVCTLDQPVVEEEL